MHWVFKGPPGAKPPRWLHVTCVVAYIAALGQPVPQIRCTVAECELFLQHFPQSEDTTLVQGVVDVLRSPPLDALAPGGEGGDPELPQVM